MHRGACARLNANPPVIDGSFEGNDSRLLKDDEIMADENFAEKQLNLDYPLPQNGSYRYWERRLREKNGGRNLFWKSCHREVFDSVGNEVPRGGQSISLSSQLRWRASRNEGVLRQSSQSLFNERLYYHSESEVIRSTHLLQWQQMKCIHFTRFVGMIQRITRAQWKKLHDGV